MARLAAEACARAKCYPITFHGLRSSAGVRWLEQGVSLDNVSQLLRHRDYSTTAKHYAGVTERHLAEVIAGLDAARSPERSPDLRIVRRKKGG